MVVRWPSINHARHLRQRLNIDCIMKRAQRRTVWDPKYHGQTRVVMLAFTA
jgi:hypothetical protein